MVELTFEDLRVNLWRRDAKGEAHLLAKLIGEISREGRISRIRAMSSDGGPVVFISGDPAMVWAIATLEALDGLPRTIQERKEIHVQLP